MKSFKIKLLDDRVMIKPITQEEKTRSGIVLPDSAEKERPEQGKVIEVGPGKLMKDGSRRKPEVKKGDQVLFTKYGPTEVKINDKEYLIAREEDILAVLS